MRKRDHKNCRAGWEKSSTGKNHNGGLHSVSSFCTRSMIVSKLYASQLNRDIPIATPFVKVSQIGHREVKEVAPRSQNSQRVAEGFPSFCFCSSQKYSTFFKRVKRIFLSPHMWQNGSLHFRISPYLLITTI